MDYPYKVDMSVFEDVLKNNRLKYKFYISLIQIKETMICSIEYIMLKVIVFPFMKSEILLIYLIIVIIHTIN